MCGCLCVWGGETERECVWVCVSMWVYKGRGDVHTESACLASLSAWTHGHAIGTKDKPPTHRPSLPSFSTTNIHSTTTTTSPHHFFPPPAAHSTPINQSINQSINQPFIPTTGVDPPPPPPPPPGGGAAAAEGGGGGDTGAQGGGGVYVLVCCGMCVCLRRRGMVCFGEGRGGIGRA